MFMQQMASDIFVRILRGMGACRKKPAQPASGTLSWMTPSETLLRLCLGGFGDMKWGGVAAGVFRHFFAKQRLLLAFVRFHGPIFETEKPFENVCTTRGLPCSLAIGARKSFSRLHLSHYPILGRLLSQFEAPIGRGKLWGPGR